MKVMNTKPKIRCNRISYITISLVMTGLLLTGCGRADTAESPAPVSEWTAPLPADPVSDGPEQVEGAGFPVHIEEVNMTVPGMKDKVKLAFLSDLHITVADDEIEDGEKENVNMRRESFSNEGIVSEDQCPEWMKILNETKADHVLLGGDLIDFASDANIKVLKKGLENLTIPFMYIRADHDTEPFYLKDKDYEKCISLQKDLCQYEDVFVKEFPDFLIIGWNNSTVQLTAEGLERINDALASKKPAILLTHVPIEPLSDKSLEKASRDTFAGRSLLWGFGQNDQAPNEYTSELLNMIYADDTPFVEILAGHLHFSWDGNVSDKVHEHVFGPAFYGYMGIINISGED